MRTGRVNLRICTSSELSLGFFPLMVDEVSHIYDILKAYNYFPSKNFLE